jgi:hypothetical protein
VESQSNDCLPLARPVAGADLTDADLTGATTTGASFAGAALAGVRGLAQPRAEKDAAAANGLWLLSAVADAVELPASAE